MVRLESKRFDGVDILNVHIGDITIEVDSLSYAVIVGVTMMHGCMSGKGLLEQVLLAKGAEVVEIEEGKFLDYSSWVKGKSFLYGNSINHYYNQIIIAMEKNGDFGESEYVPF
jgi:hypothetical protein